MKLPSVKLFFLLYFVISITFTTLNFSIVFLTILANIQIYTWHTLIHTQIHSSSTSIGKSLTLMFGIGFVCNNGSPACEMEGEREREKVCLFDEIKIYVTYLNRNPAYIFIRQAADIYTHMHL